MCHLRYMVRAYCVITVHFNKVVHRLIYQLINIQLIKKTKTMSKKIQPKNNQANQQNPNKGTSGTNKQYSQNQGNKGKQLNPNYTGKKK